ncbi:hypothetical protein EJB05_29316, partial [Eragrostis curvula]
MAPSASTFHAILFLLFVAITHGSYGAIHKKTALDGLCETLGSYYITPEQCASALCYNQSMPCNTAHNVPALAALATNLTVFNATVTRDRIKAAISSFVAMYNSTAADEEAEEAMLSCLDLYTGIIPSLKWAAHSVAAGHYHGAR